MRVTNRSQKFIIDADGAVIPVPLLVWAEWVEQQAKRGFTGLEIAYSVWPGREKDRRDRARILTFFLGLDFAFGDHGPHMLYETQLFWPDSEDLNGAAPRSATLDAARALHDELAASVAASLGPPGLDRRAVSPVTREAAICYREDDDGRS